MIGLVDMDGTESDSELTSQSGHPASNESHADEGNTDENKNIGTNHDAETTRAADDEPTSPHEPPEEPKVLVAVICRGAASARWQWAVSEPAG